MSLNYAEWDGDDLRTPNDGTVTTRRCSKTARHSSPGGINRQAQRCRSARVDDRRADQARQPLASVEDRRADALGLRKAGLSRPRGWGGCTAYVQSIERASVTG